MTNVLSVTALLFTRPKHILLHCLKLLQQRDNFVLSQVCYFAFPVPLSFLLPQHFKRVIVLLALTLQFDNPCSNFFCFSTKGAKPTAWQSSLPLKAPGRPICCNFLLLRWTKMGGRAGTREVLIPLLQLLWHSEVWKTNAVTNLSILSHLSCQLELICLSNSKTSSSHSSFMTN